MEPDMTRKEYEEKLVQRIKYIGIEKCMSIADGAHYYYRFILKNGEEHYFKDVSREHLDYLGIE
jgi:hypothetical protein